MRSKFSYIMMFFSIIFKVSAQSDIKNIVHDSLPSIESIKIQDLNIKRTDSTSFSSIKKDSIISKGHVTNVINDIKSEIKNKQPKSNKLKNILSGELLNGIGYGVTPNSFDSSTAKLYHQHVGKLNFNYIIPLTLNFEFNNFNTTGLYKNVSLSFNRDAFDNNLKQYDGVKNKLMDHYRDSINGVKTGYFKKILFLEKYKKYQKPETMGNLNYPKDSIKQGNGNLSEIFDDKKDSNLYGKDGDSISKISVRGQQSDSLTGLKNKQTSLFSNISDTVGMLKANYQYKLAQIDCLLDPENSDSLKYHPIDTEKYIDSLNDEWANYVKKIKVLEKVDRMSSVTSLSKVSALNKPDSLTGSLISNSSLDSNAFENGKLKQFQSYSEKMDSVNRLISQYQSKMNQADSLMALEGKDIDTSSGNRLISRYSRFNSVLSVIKKLQIGNFSPDNSVFLVSNSLVKGYMIEIEKSVYLSAIKGEIVDDPFLTASNSVQNQVNNQIADILNFKGNENNKKILSFKAGMGDLNKDHVHVGLLWGTGKHFQYFNGETQSITEKNLVVELEGRIIKDKRCIVDANYAKSLLSGFHNTGTRENLSLNSLIRRRLSSAYCVKVSSELEKIKTNLGFSVRYIEPFFESFGNTFLPQDNLRLELTGRHQLSKRVKINFKYRNEQNNLHHFTTFSFAQNNLLIGSNIKLTRKLVLSLMTNPIIYKIYDTDGSQVEFKNLITTAVVNYNMRIKKKPCQLSVVYSNYLLADTNSIQSSHTANVQQTIPLSEKVQFLTGANYQLSNYTGKSYSLIGVELGAGLTLSKSTSLDLSLKSAYINYSTVDYGLSLKLSQKIASFLSCEISGEKLIRYENMIYPEQEIISMKFPYFINLSLMTKW